MTFNKKRIIALLTMLAMIVIYLPAYAIDHQENVCLYQFDTVSLENISDDNATIYLDGYYEAVLYDENGNFSTCSKLKNITDYSDNLKLAPNEKIIISCDGGAYLNLTYP